MKALPLLVPQTVEEVKAKTEKELAEQETKIKTMETESLEIRNRMAKTEHESLSEKEEREKLQKDFDSFKEQMALFAKINAGAEFKKKRVEDEENDREENARILRENKEEKK